jgi:4-methyl-5(b-hydroxyethyl)-thiazole monophosphate biosynthesis
MARILVYLAPGFEEIEAVTIIDLLRRADIDVTVAGLEQNTVTGSHGITVKCDAFYQDINPDDFDYLILPGGQPGTNNLKNDARVKAALQSFERKNKIIGAICAAPTVLQEAGVLNNKRLTCYPSEKGKFEAALYREDKVVSDGNIITSRGVGTAIDFALDLIGKIKGGQTKQEIAERILWKI